MSTWQLVGVFALFAFAVIGFTLGGAWFALHITKDPGRDNDKGKK